MVICGIDPGYDRAGYAFLNVEKNKPEVLAYGLISTSKNHSFEERLLEVGHDIIHLFELYKPNYVFLETLFVGRNLKTVLKVAEIRGMLKFIAQQHYINVMELAPVSIKKNISGYGMADKGQMIRAITMLLALPAPPSPDDVADALSIAFCGYIKVS